MEINSYRKEINKSLEDGIKENIIDTSTDYLEIGLDGIMESLLSESFLENIPWFKTAYGAYKGVVAYRDLAFMRKLIIFLQVLHKDEFDSKKHEEYLISLSSDPKEKAKILNSLTEIIDKILGGEKAHYLANLFRSHINGKISWIEFIGFSECLNNLNPIALNKETAKRVAELDYKADLMKGDIDSIIPFYLSVGLGLWDGERFELTKNGRLFIKCCFGTNPQPRPCMYGVQIG